VLDVFAEVARDFSRLKGVCSLAMWPQSSPS